MNPCILFIYVQTSNMYCTHTHTHTYTHTHTHTHNNIYRVAFAFMHAYVHLCMYPIVCIRMYACIYICMHMYVHVWMFACVCMCIRGAFVGLQTNTPSLSIMLIIISIIFHGIFILCRVCRYCFVNPSFMATCSLYLFSRSRGSPVGGADTNLILNGSRG